MSFFLGSDKKPLPDLLAIPGFQAGYTGRLTKITHGLL